MWTVEALAADLAAGRTTSRALVETSLARIAEPSGEGARAFMSCKEPNGLVHRRRAHILDLTQKHRWNLTQIPP